MKTDGTKEFGTWLPDGDNLGEECGVMGIYDLDGDDVASSIYYGLFALQHRGQESCGIAVSETAGPPRNVKPHKGMGLVNEVFNAENLEKLTGDIGVGMCVIPQQAPAHRKTSSPWH